LQNRWQAASDSALPQRSNSASAGQASRTRPPAVLLPDSALASGSNVPMLFQLRSSKTRSGSVVVVTVVLLFVVLLLLLLECSVAPAKSVSMDSIPFSLK
jgi:hypothetical protein